jgi:hypothetical protein
LGGGSCVRQNRVVLAPVAGVKPAKVCKAQPGNASRQFAGDGGKRNSSPGRARHKPSNHCAGNAGLFRLYLYARVRILECILHTRPRVPAGTRHSLRPLIFEGKLQASLGRHAPRECETLSSRHCERSEAIHRAAKEVRMDCFALLAMTWIGHGILSDMVAIGSCSSGQNGLLKNLDPFNPYRHGNSTAFVIPIRTPAAMSGLPSRACSANGG